MTEKCTSCGTVVSRNYTKFKCPKCSKSEIVRCPSCRSLSAKYSCADCGFQGP
ncbi:MAG: zinc finger domain-containing protein [Candidatus Altiarchaeota archaeon]